MNKTGLFLLSISIAFVGLGQKKELNHTVYNDWKSLNNSIISNDGKYVSHEINPHRGDGYLYIINNVTGQKDSVPRGKNAKFTGGSNFLLFEITPGFDTLRNCELNKIDKKKWPKDSLAVYSLLKDSLIKIPKVNSFNTNDENDWFYYITEPEKKTEKKKKCFLRKKKQEEEYKSDGKELHIENYSLNKSYVHSDVTKASFSEKGKHLTIISQRKYEADSIWIKLFHTENEGLTEMHERYSDVSQLSFNKSEDKMAFLTSSDTSKAKNYALRLFDMKDQILDVIADTNAGFLNSGQAVSKNFGPKFTEDGRMLYFGVADRETEELKDTLLANEKVKLDLWHHKDKRLQPQQINELKRDQRETNLYAYHFNGKKIVQLSNDTLEVSSDDKLQGNYLLGISNEKYAHTYNWAIPYPEDHYLVSVETGEAELLFSGIEFGGSLSPSGKYYTYFDSDSMNYFAVSIDNRKEFCLTCNAEDIYWQSDVNGMPMKAYPLGVIGWKKGEDKVWIQSEYDIWEYSFEKDDIISVTGKEGEVNQIKLSPEVWSRDSTYLDINNIYIYGFDEKTKGEHYYKIVEHNDHADLSELTYVDAKISSIYKAKDDEAIIYRLQTFKDYPDVYTSNIEFENSKKMSVTNPQQDEFKWGSVELINWTTYEGIPLEGLLYKPEDYDPDKKYPLLVYYYELKSNSLHQHYIPKPTASIIYPAEYASAGYVVFIPDIKYTPGYPARSAYDCIMSGTDRVIELLPNIDTMRMGLQGQSWGGYQTAQLITMTKRYAAAMAGAPVSNMFSAYGGIRWGSGLNRQFQYERTQSRIGYTIWEKPELYFENSPLFHLPNVTTPLMIMHNDKDGAVPWYQGIELFTGLKRLGKETWLLNYNDDDHNLMKNANRIDLSIRMRQFFDYYLMGEEAPQWLREGIPAMVKGKELRY